MRPDGIADIERDGLYFEAAALARELRRLRVVDLQRRLSVGYSRATRLLEQLVRGGVVDGEGRVRGE